MLHRLLPLNLAIVSLFPTFTLADTVESINSKVLGTISVTAKSNYRSTTQERKNKETLENEMIRDTKDLVRYLADVGIADDGRRTKGFAMRGVEDNRVGISIDDVSLPDSEENSLYARYGNFNNSRLSIDPELVRNIDITKGSDSFASGSGALGGNVNYRTLNASDLVQADRQFGGMFKSGYATKNREWVNTIGLGFMNDRFDAALLYSHRRGHETKSNDGDIQLYRPSRYTTDYEMNRLAQVGQARVKPDPSAHRNHSYLAKFGWQITPEHRVGVALTKQDNSNYIKEYSYALTTSWREADDVQKRTNTNLYYEWLPESTPIAKIRADFDYQKTENGSINYKGNYDQLGNWRTGYTYEQGALAERDFRNNETKFKRLSLQADAKSFDLGKTNHRLSFKVFAAEREFENRNEDVDLDSKTGKITNTDIYTIQYPMKTKQYGAALSDNITFNNRLSGYLAARYDYEKVKPQDLSLPCGAQSNFGRLCGAVDKAGTSFSNWSGALGLDFKLNDTWKVGYQASMGYRVPTASEMYFTFESAYGNWLANPNLKAERALTQTLSLQGRGAKGSLDVNVYHSKYRDFLFEKESSMKRTDPTCDWYASYYTGCTGERTDYFQQMVNLDKARIAGLEVKGSLNLNNHWKFSGSLGYSKGKLSGDDKVSLLSIQPLKMVLGLDYTAPSEKWGIFSRLNFMAAKKAKDAQIAELKEGCHRYKIDWYGNPTDECESGQEYTYSKVMDFRWLNKKAWTLDVFGYYKPMQNFIVRAGVYNVFNTRYHPWDSLRGINPRSTINSLSVQNSERAKQGSERFHAPGRNFAVSVEYKF